MLLVGIVVYIHQQQVSQQVELFVIITQETHVYGRIRLQLQIVMVIMCFFLVHRQTVI